MARLNSLVVVLATYSIIFTVLSAIALDAAHKNNVELRADNELLSMRVSELSRLCFVNLSHPAGIR